MSRLRAIIAIPASSWGEVIGEVTKYTGVVRTVRVKGGGREGGVKGRTGRSSAMSLCSPPVVPGGEQARAKGPGVY